MPCLRSWPWTWDREYIAPQTRQRHEQIHPISDHINICIFPHRWKMIIKLVTRSRVSTLRVVEIDNWILYKISLLYTWRPNAKGDRKGIFSLSNHPTTSIQPKSCPRTKDHLVSSILTRGLRHGTHSTFHLENRNRSPKIWYIPVCRNRKLPMLIIFYTCIWISNIMVYNWYRTELRWLSLLLAELKSTRAKETFRRLDSFILLNFYTLIFFTVRGCFKD